MTKKKRKSGDGTIRQRNDGRWEGRIVIAYDEKGLPKTKNVLAKTKRECSEKLEKLKAELGATDTTKCSSEMPFGKWMDHWYRTYCKNTLKDYTQKTYEQRIYKQIIPKIGHLPLNKITTGTLERFYAELKTDGRLVRREQNGNGLSNSVIRSIHAHCRAALQKAVDEGLITKDPAVRCKLPPKRSAEIKILSPEEMQKLLYQAQIEGFYEMFLLDLSTGLRRGELLGLKWADIDLEESTLSVKRQVRFEKGKLKISSPKTKASERTIVLPLPITEMLKEYKEKTHSEWLFPSPVKDEDVPRDPTACRKRLSQILERSGCKHVPFHALRHTFASHAFHYGMDVKTLASTIGHESVETTLNVYAHTSERMKQDAAKQIESTIGMATGEKFALCGDEKSGEQLCENKAEQAPRRVFEPYKPKYRRRSTGSVHRISENTWEGRYTPTVNGKRIARNIYAHTEKECEQKLAELIQEMKAELGITG